MDEFLQHTDIELIGTNGDSLVLPSYSKLTINKSITQKLSTFSLTVNAFDDSDMRDFGVGTQVNVYTAKQDQEKELIFKGIVSENPRKINGQIIEYQYNGSDKLFPMQHTLINESYQNWLVTDIIEDLITKYGVTEEGDILFTLNYLQPSSYTVSVSFKDAFLYDALEKLTNAINYTFLINLDDSVDFFELNSKQNLTPIKKDDYYKGTASFSFDRTRLCNSLRVYGGQNLSLDVTQYITGDGLNSTFLLNHKPRISSNGEVEVYLNNVKQSVGIDNISNGVDCVINYQEKLISFKTLDGQEKVLQSSDRVKLVYRYEYPMVISEREPQSIKTYGLFADVIKFPELTNKNDLKNRAKVHFQKYAKPIITGSIETWKEDYEVGDNVLVEIEMNQGYFLNEWLQITEKVFNFEPNLLKINLNFETKVVLSSVIKDILDRLAELEKSYEEEPVEIITTILDDVPIREKITMTETYDLGFRIGINAVGDKL